MYKENFVKLFEDSVRSSWELPALSDYRKSTRTYQDLAREIEKLDLIWKKAGLKAGDKIAINAKSSSMTALVFMAAASRGYVAVMLFNGFTPADTQRLIDHSDARILYTEKRIFDAMDFAAFPKVLCAIDANTGEILADRQDTAKLYESGDALLSEKHPQGMKPEAFRCTLGDPEEVCAILYTSGSTGNPKGVMLTNRNYSANVDVIFQGFPFRRGESYLSLLPHAHSFGLICDVVIPLCHGMHVTVLGIPPIPSNVRDALMDVKPHIFYGVPLIFTKFAQYILGSYLNDPEGAGKLKNYEQHPDYCRMLRDVLLSSMGGNIEVFATGGAAIPSEVESLFVHKLKVPFITGYGLTECAPIIAYGKIGHYIPKSCGQYTHQVLELKIDSPDPAHIAGEVSVRGDVVFKGYYKNPEATAEVLSEDGWFRTGDMGTVDDRRNLFLVGRCKNMLLSSSGQNIYPEEIEVVLNEYPFVAESIVLQRDEHLVALIVPDLDALDKASLNAEALDSVMRQNIEKLNANIPAYAAVSDYEVRFEPFAKTPKGSIRRFLYK